MSHRPLQLTLGAQHGLDLSELFTALRSLGYRIEVTPPGFPENYWLIEKETTT